MTQLILLCLLSIFLGSVYLIGCSTEVPCDATRLNCKQALQCEGACTDGDEACRTACEAKIAVGSRGTYDRANQCINDSGCATTDCVHAACSAPLTACTSDSAPICGFSAVDAGVVDAGVVDAGVAGCLPTCIAQLKTQCPPLVGGCTVEVTASVEARFCYDNGSKMRVPLTGSTSSFVGCPSLLYDTSYASGTVSFTNAVGTLVATVSPAGGTLFNIACDGQTYSVDGNSQACVDDLHAAGVLRNAETSQCIAGTCAIGF